MCLPYSSSFILKSLIPHTSYLILYISYLMLRILYFILMLLTLSFLFFSLLHKSGDKSAKHYGRPCRTSGYIPRRNFAASARPDFLFRPGNAGLSECCNTSSGVPNGRETISLRHKEPRSGKTARLSVLRARSTPVRVRSGYVSPAYSSCRKC